MYKAVRTDGLLSYNGDKSDGAKSVCWSSTYNKLQVRVRNEGNDLQYIIPVLTGRIHKVMWGWTCFWQLARPAKITVITQGKNLLPDTRRWSFHDSAKLKMVKELCWLTTYTKPLDKYNAYDVRKKILVTYNCGLTLMSEANDWLLVKEVN